MLYDEHSALQFNRWSKLYKGCKHTNKLEEVTYNIDFIIINSSSLNWFCWFQDSNKIYYKYNKQSKNQHFCSIFSLHGTNCSSLFVVYYALFVHFSVAVYDKSLILKETNILRVARSGQSTNSVFKEGNMGGSII